MKLRQVGAIGAVTVLLALIASAGGTASTQAAGESVVREAVVSKLGPDGSKLSTFVSQLVLIDSEGNKDVEISVPDGAELNSYRNLSGFSGPSGEGDNLVWRSNDDLSATVLAEIDKELPAAIDVRYYVDNKEVTAEEVSGMSGDVRLEIDIENISGESTSLEHKATTSPLLTSIVNEYVPLEYIIRVTFPNDVWQRVGGQGVVVQPVDNDQVATANGVLTPPFGDAEATAVFEATSDDILRPRIQVYATPKVSQRILDSLQEQFEALSALYGGVGDISDNLETIYEGTVELVDGAEDLLAGVGENDADGNPKIELDSAGLPTTLLGTLGFLSNAVDDQILPGIGVVDPETGEGVITKDEKGHTETLIGGLQSQKDTYDDDLIPAMKDAVAGVKDAIELVGDGGDELVDALEQVEAGLEAMIAAIESGDPNDPGLKEGLEQIEDGLTALIANLDGAFRAGMNEVQDGLEALITQLDTLFRGGLQQVAGGLTTLTQSLLTQFRPGLQQVDGGLAQLLTGAAQFRTGLSDLRTGIAGITAVFPGVPGLDLYVANLLAGADTLLGSFGNTGSPATTIFGGLEAVKAGSAQLLAALGDTGSASTTVIGGLEAMQAGVNQLIAGLGDNGSPVTTVIGALEAMNAGMVQLIAGLGQTSSTPSSATVIGALQLLQAGMGQILDGLGSTGATPTDDTLIGGLLLLSAGMGQITPGAEELVSSVLGGLEDIMFGYSNPQFTKPQDALDGKTPKEYYQDCPACFDPDSDMFDPATANPLFQPSLLEVFTLFSEGIEDALPQLDSLDEDAPGLRDGLEQVVDGLDELAAALDTGDADDPGLVDGMELVRGGLQQVNQGLFALNELGLRTLKGTVGDQGDTVGRDQAVLKNKADELATTSALGATADNVSTTYVFDSAAESTATRDNLVRGSLMALALALMAVLAHRPRVLDL